jgi:hypothetical protein
VLELAALRVERAPPPTRSGDSRHVGLEVAARVEGLALMRATHE